MSRHQLNNEIQGEDWYTAEDYENDLKAILSTVNDLSDGNKRFPKVADSYGVEIAVAARLLTQMAAEHGGI